MKVTTKKLLVMASLLLICISFVGCGSSDDITGTWIHVESESSDGGMRFYEDGTCLDVYKNHTSADATNWKIQEDGMLILEMEWDGNESFERVNKKEEALEDRDLYYLSGGTLVYVYYT
ncbi:MAG: lipocalin family protein, partial [Lachnospiraceae bacterium]|nr:lipocalin family protein [Lachnospiraceae bacterium]